MIGGIEIGIGRGKKTTKIRIGIDNIVMRRKKYGKNHEGGTAAVIVKGRKSKSAQKDHNKVVKGKIFIKLGREVPLEAEIEGIKNTHGIKVTKVHLNAESRGRERIGLRRQTVRSHNLRKIHIIARGKRLRG